MKRPQCFISIVVDFHDIWHVINLDCTHVIVNQRILDARSFGLGRREQELFEDAEESFQVITPMKEQMAPTRDTPKQIDVAIIPLM